MILKSSKITQIFATMAFGAVLMMPLSALAVIETESFDSQAGAAAHGWTAFNGGDPHDLDWKGSMNAGGAAGEGGGTLSRQNTVGEGAYYADLTIGTLTHGVDALTASGRFQFQNNAGYNGLGVIGYFDANNGAEGPAMGMWFTDNNATTYRVSPGFHDQGAANSTFSALHVLDYGTPYQFELSTVGTTINLTVKDVTGANTLFTDSVNNPNAFTLNAFGLLSTRINSGTGGNDALTVESYIDDLSYFSAVPEPSSVALWMLGSAGMALAALRRHCRWKRLSDREDLEFVE